MSEADPRPDGARVAAREAAARLMRAMVEPMAGTMYDQVPSPDWFTALIKRHKAMMAAGEGRGCVHVIQEGPQVCHMAVWHPGRVVCGRCAAEGALRPDGVEDRTCDRCRQHLPEGVILNVVQVGMYLVWLGLCRPCRDTWLDQTGQTAG